MNGLIALALAKKFTSTEVGKIPSPYTVKPAVATYNDLPQSGNTAGDVRKVTSTGDSYYWDGNAWQAFVAYKIVDYTVTYADGTTGTIHNVEA